MTEKYTNLLHLCRLGKTVVVAKFIGVSSVMLSNCSVIAVKTNNKSVQSKPQSIYKSSVIDTVCTLLPYYYFYIYTKFWLFLVCSVLLVLSPPPPLLAPPLQLLPWLVESCVLLMHNTDGYYGAAHKLIMLEINCCCQRQPPTCPSVSLCPLMHGSSWWSRCLHSAPLLLRSAQKWYGPLTFAVSLCSVCPPSHPDSFRIQCRFIADLTYVTSNNIDKWQDFISLDKIFLVSSIFFVCLFISLWSHDFLNITYY